MWFLWQGCASEFEIQVTPPEVDLGVVDFAQEMPADGYAPASVEFTNAGTGTPSLSLSDYDPDHLCVAGFTGRELPIPMGTLAEGSTYLLRVAACDYTAGERDTQVQTEIRVGTGGSPAVLVVPVWFTPTRSFGDDSG